MMKKEIRILVTDAHTMFREALNMVLAQEPDFRVVGEAVSGKETVEQTSGLDPDIVLLDWLVSHPAAVETLRRLAQNKSRARTILFESAMAASETAEVLKLGVRGFFSKEDTPQLLFKGIRAVHSGEFWVGHRKIADLVGYLKAASQEAAPDGRNGFHLTPREMDIVTSIVDGYTNKEIAGKFSISEQTVKHHLTSIFGKVGVTNRLELALFAVHHSFAA